MTNIFASESTIIQFD